MKAVTPPVETTPPTTSPADATHAGHIWPPYFFASARCRIRSLMLVQPVFTPRRCSS
jgi:hypothetical protein